MDFEPRESRLVTFGKRAVAVGVVLLFVVTLYWRAPFNSPLRSLFGRRTLSLTNEVSTFAEGYPFAVKLKDRMATDAQLLIVAAFLNREGDHFKIQMLDYLFASEAGKGVKVGILNVRRQAYALELSGPRKAALSEPGELSLLVLPLIDIPQLIEIAGTNGFSEFAARIGKDCYLSLSLMSVTNRPYWLMKAWDLKDLQAKDEFSVAIDARTGGVMPEYFQQSTWRRYPPE